MTDKIAKASNDKIKENDPDENVKVAIRFRAGVEDDKKFWSVQGNTINVQNSEFTFDTVFLPSTSQQEVFEKIAKNAVIWVSQGYNSTIFAYGCSGSGKTYTLFGFGGVVPSSCELLFKLINDNPEVKDASMKCSFYEIYKEQLIDLLSPKGMSGANGANDMGSQNPRDSQLNSKLKIRHSPHGVYVENLIEKFVCSPADILATIKDGASQRSTASTSLNNTSSRSHAVLTLTLNQKMNDCSELISRLNIVDLAGSENVGKSEVQGNTLQESQMINRSLSCLGNVIYALTEKGREHIPYRDSKLTHILQDSLGGNSKTIILATINPLSTQITETLTTLKFAKRAKEIKNAPKVNKNDSITNLLKIIDEQAKKIKELEEGLIETKEIVDKVENVHTENEVGVLVKIKIERLEKSISGLTSLLEKEKERYVKHKKLYIKQRKYSKKIAEELYREKIKCNQYCNELEQYKMYYDSFKEAVEISETIDMNGANGANEVLRLLVKNATIDIKPLVIDESILKEFEEADELSPF